MAMPDHPPGFSETPPLTEDASHDAGVAGAFAPEPDIDMDSLRAAVLRQIRHLIDFYRIEPDELRVPLVPLETPESAPVEAPIKYRHPVSGLTWNGVGAQPDWLRHALLQEGYRVAELKVTPPPDLG